MLATGKITKRGLLTPVNDIPYLDLNGKSQNGGFASRQRLLVVNRDGKRAEQVMRRHIETNCEELLAVLNAQR